MTRFNNTAATGGVLAAILAKRMLVGRSPLAASPRVFNLAVLLAGTPVAIALSRHAALGSVLGVALRNGIFVTRI